MSKSLVMMVGGAALALLPGTARATSWYEVDCYSPDWVWEGSYFRDCDGNVESWGRTSGDMCYWDSGECSWEPPCDGQICPWPEYWDYDLCMCVGGW